MITYDPDLKIFSSSLINDNCFISGFATKELGDGTKTEIILNFLKENEINYSKLVVPGQIHSTNVEFVSPVDNQNFLKVEDTDGVITDKKNIVLTVRIADCLPIIFGEKKAGLIGISHQGWRGSLKKMVIKMVEKIIEKGGARENIQVAIGPGIGQCCYDVDEDRYYQFLEELNGYSEKIFRTSKGKKHLNLSFLNYLLLITNGIKKENIDFFPFCTCCDKERFFSFRRDSKKEFGEMFSFILMNR